MRASPVPGGEVFFIHYVSPRIQNLKCLTVRLCWGVLSSCFMLLADITSYLETPYLNMSPKTPHVPINWIRMTLNKTPVKEWLIIMSAFAWEKLCPMEGTHPPPVEELWKKFKRHVPTQALMSTLCKRNTDDLQRSIISKRLCDKGSDDCDKHLSTYCHFCATMSAYGT